jgi:hypothetical protein
MYQSALAAAERSINRPEFPMSSLCSAILLQIEHDWRSAASAYDNNALDKVRREILYPSGLVTNILECCDCSPEKFLTRLEEMFPLGCSRPTHRKKGCRESEF